MLTSNFAITYCLHGKKFGADDAPGGEAVAFSGGELCDYAFGYAAFPLWVSSCYIPVKLKILVSESCHASII